MEMDEVVRGRNLGSLGHPVILAAMAGPAMVAPAMVAPALPGSRGAIYQCCYNR